MKKMIRTLAFAGLTFMSANNLSAALESTTNSQTENYKEFSQEDVNKISEALGHFIGKNLNTPGIHFDLESVVKGIRDAAAGKPAPMTDQEYEEKMVQLQKNALAKLAEKNLQEANEFLGKNVREAGIVEIEPGKLQYQVIEQGNGATVEPNSRPLINYTGKLLDGTVFGRSSEVGGPITLPLDQTIPGFKKGIQGMKEGEKRRLFIHPDLAYGTLGHLPPNSLLIFEIEVVKADTPKTSANEEDELLPLAMDDDNDDDEDDDEDDDDDSDDDEDDDDEDDDDEDDDKSDADAQKGKSKTV